MKTLTKSFTVTLGTLIAALFVFELSTQSFAKVAPIQELSPNAKIEGPFRGNERFSAGDKFDRKKIPMQLNADADVWLTAYQAAKGLKTLAISDDGMVYAVLNSAGASSAAEIERMALEGCQIASQNHACSIFATGDKLRYDERDFHAKMQKRISEGTAAFDQTTLPFATDDTRANWDLTSLQDSPFKTLAFNVFNQSYFWGKSHASQQDADRNALQMCEAYSRKPCTIYARQDQVVYDVAKSRLNTTSAIDFNQSTVQANNFPILSDEGQSWLHSKYSVQLENDPVIVMTYFGYVAIGSIGESESEKTANAMEQCAMDNGGSSADCFIYSIGRRVQLKSSIELRCNSNVIDGLCM